MPNRIGSRLQITDLPLHAATFFITHNALSPEKMFGDPSGYPDDVTLDAISCTKGINGNPDPDGRAVRAVLQKTMFPGAEWACFARGKKRITRTEKDTKAALAAFKMTVMGNGNHATPGVQNYFFGTTN